MSRRSRPLGGERASRSIKVKGCCAAWSFRSNSCRGTGKLYVIGGSDGSQSLCSVEIYEPRMNRWSAGPSLSISRANLEAVELEGNLFAIGGYSGKTFLSSLEILNNDEWSGFIQV